MAVEHRVHGADRWRLHVVAASAQLLADLGCAPARVLALELDDQALDRQRQLVGLPERPAAAISEAFGPQVLVTLEDLVAGLARDVELTTELCHLFALEESGDET